MGITYEDEKPSKITYDNEIPKHEKFLKNAARISSGFTRGFAEAETLGLSDLAENIADRLTQAPNPVQSQVEDLMDFSPSARLVGAAVPISHGLFSIGNSIRKGFFKGNLPKQISITKSEQNNIFNRGKGRIQERLNEIFRNANRDFEEKLAKVPVSQNTTHSDFSSVLLNAAEDYGNTDITGSPGNILFEHAKDFARGGNRVMPAGEAQANYRSILKTLPDEASKATLNNHYGAMLEQEIPALATARAEHAPIYQIAKQAKEINVARLRQVASDTIDSETLGHMTQAEQMAGVEPGEVELASKLGDKLRGQQNKLQKIVGRQNLTKNILGRAVTTVPIVGGLELLRRALKNHK